ncbi:hypothetical protein [Cellulomonas xiejunii]|uniref:DUF998 domain-containing protein n=1 Tax=Cellulomonas xiejunii TaxID=2968083 RepID=A0ABY5KK08_9CELL|nr:hypothetical protein [Cellulomonas xiejunii]UUI70170.1 hypothetical protein NP048_10050 [Cellulomonas xiejunii]
MELGGMSTAERRAVRSTYRSLRLGVVLLLVLLVTAVAVEASRAGCWLDSLSAYYWTGAHDAVVGALCAVGTLLVVYTGTDDVEDALLDIAGFLALVVALTPTEPGSGCPGDVVADVPAALADARTSLTALVVAGLLATGARTFVAVRSGGSTPATLARGAGALVVLAVAVTLVAAPDVLLRSAHDTAAVLLFVAVVAVVVRNAFAARAVSSRWALAYALLGATMLLTLSVVVALNATVETWAHAVLVVEALLVGLFAAFWVLQTIEHWGAEVARSRVTPR